MEPAWQLTYNIVFITFSLANLTDPCSSYQPLVIENSTHGYIESPNYPSNYPVNATCSWKIKIPDGIRMSINVTDIAVEKWYKEIIISQKLWFVLSFNDWNYHNIWWYSSKAINNYETLPHILAHLFPQSTPISFPFLIPSLQFPKQKIGYYKDFCFSYASY